jgi:hypothetical protein
VNSCATAGMTPSAPAIRRTARRLPPSIGVIPRADRVC